MVVPDPVMARIGDGIARGQRGERDAARHLFAELWEEIGRDSGDPLYRCALAHSMADVQDDVRDELLWDLRALEAADLITEERAARADIGAVSAFYPSLHLNLAECYRKLGDAAQARDHLRRGEAAAAALGDDAYGTMIKTGLARLADRIDGR